MIYTITLTPVIEKRVIGEYYDELRFDAQHFSYHIGGVGLKTSLYLKKANIDSVAAYICGIKEASFIKEKLTKEQIEQIAMETGFPIAYRNVFIDEKEEVMIQEEKKQSLDDTQLSLFSSLLKEKMEEDSLVVLEYKDTKISVEAMAKFYCEISEKKGLLLCDLHPKYYSCINTCKTDLFLLDKKMLEIYLNQKNISLEKGIHFIQEELLSLAKMVIYMDSPNDFVFFYKNKIHRVLSMVKISNNRIIHEAILASLVECLEKDLDFENLCKEVLIASVASNIGDGIYMATSLTKEKVVNTIHIYEM